MILSRSSILQGYLTHFSAQARKIKKSNPKKIPYISGNGTFQSAPTKRKPRKNSYIFSKESTSYVSRNGNLKKIPYISRNGTFSYFRKGIFQTLGHLEIYIRGLSIFRTTGTFRTLAHSEPEAYLEHCQTSMMEHFAKIATNNISHKF